MTRLLQDWAAEQADKRPDAAALVFRDRTLSYAGLEAESNRLAHLLRDLGCRPGDRVGLLLRKSLEAIICFHAVLKAGGIYVPLDTDSPAPRLARIVSAAAPAFLLAERRSAGLLTELCELSPAAATAKLGWIERDWRDDLPKAPAFMLGDADTMPEHRPDAARRSDDAAHILFTSGSTGEPKGVVITHANVIAFVDWARSYFGIAPGDRLSGHPPLHFDLSTFDIYGSISSGAELHLIPAEMNLLPKSLVEFIREHELTQWFSVPSVLNFLAKLDLPEPNAFPSLRRLMWCGEVFPTASLIHWMRRLPRTTFTNLYGPTEATIASSYYTLSACPAGETDPVPIGAPCAGESLYVLDEARRPVPDGEMGDLYIGGAGLSPGYWQDEEKTAAAFFASPFGDDPGGRIYKTGDLARIGEDGLVYFHGRADTQIKSRGYRIELGEIETALAAMESIGECAVVGVESPGFEGTTICCAFVLREGHDLRPSKLREALAKQLPAYMLPTRWLAMDALPKNQNGKIDRPSIRARMASQFTGAGAGSESPKREPRDAAGPPTADRRAGTGK